jgi:hypothetical protein
MRLSRGQFSELHATRCDLAEVVGWRARHVYEGAAIQKGKVWSWTGQAIARIFFISRYKQIHIGLCTCACMSLEANKPDV